ncbi:MAG: hypothetical protein AAGA31_21045 [Bacteroidota bacterium]
MASGQPTTNYQVPTTFPLALLLNTLIEGIIAILFLFYPGAPNVVPGFAEAEGPSYLMLMKMYGLAALLLAGLSLLGWLKRDNQELLLSITGLLTLFHLGMAIVQAGYNPDSRAMLLHFLLVIFLGGQYVQQRKKGWQEVK